MAQPITYQCVRCQLRFTANGSKVCTECLKNPPKILVSRDKLPRPYTWKGELTEDEKERKRLAERKEKQEQKKGSVRIPVVPTVRFGKAYKGRVIGKRVRSND